MSQDVLPSAPLNPPPSSSGQDPLVVGLDLGGTKMAAALVDAGGALQGPVSSCPTPAHDGPAAGAGFALGPGDGDVADLAGHVVGASAGSPIEDEGSADPGAHRHHEDDLSPGAGTEPGLSGGIGVDVVLDVDRQLTQPLGGEPLANASGDLRAGPSGDGVSG